MIVVSPQEVRVVLASFISTRSNGQGMNFSGDLSEDCDLLLSGMIDSLGLLEMISALNDHFGQEIDFEMLDPEHMTIVGPLCDFVAEQLRHR